MTVTESIIEVWEMTTEGTAWVWVMDPRDKAYRKQRVGGRAGGSKRLHISSDDRRFNQEQVIEEMKDQDPFTNGALRLISADVPSDVDTTYHLTPDDLQAMLGIKDEELFQSSVADIKSELIVRRLKEVAETFGTVAQLEFISSLIKERYAVGGTQRTVREMLEQGEKLAGTLLSN